MNYTYDIEKVIPTDFSISFLSRKTANLFFEILIDYFDEIQTIIDDFDCDEVVAVKIFEESRKKRQR